MEAGKFKILSPPAFLLSLEVIVPRLNMKQLGIPMDIGKIPKKGIKK
jgi:hypothetical protein